METCGLEAAIDVFCVFNYNFELQLSNNTLQVLYE